MARQYKIIRIPQEANEALKLKQTAMSDVYKKLTGRTKKLPITRIVSIVSAQPIMLSDTELVTIFRGKKRRMIC